MKGTTACCWSWFLALLASHYFQCLFCCCNSASSCIPSPYLRGCMSSVDLKNQSCNQQIVWAAWSLFHAALICDKFECLSSSMSEMKMEDILASLMLEDGVKGRGQWGNKVGVHLHKPVTCRSSLLILQWTSKPFLLATKAFMYRIINIKQWKCNVFINHSNLWLGGGCHSKETSSY